MSDKYRRFIEPWEIHLTGLFMYTCMKTCHTLLPLGLGCLLEARVPSAWSPALHCLGIVGPYGGRASWEQWHLWGPVLEGEAGTLPSLPLSLHLGISEFLHHVLLPCYVLHHRLKSNRETESSKTVGQGEPFLSLSIISGVCYSSGKLASTARYNKVVFSFQEGRILSILYNSSYDPPLP